MDISRLVKAPKNIKQSNILKQKYYHLVIFLVRSYNRIISGVNPQRPPEGNGSLHEIWLRSRKRSDISDHLTVLYSESKLLNPKLIVELGVGPGESHYVFQKIADESGAVMVSVDRNPETIKASVPGRNYINSDDIIFAEQFEGWCRGRVLEPSIDILFIDTSHLYEHTLKEITSWFPFLAPSCKVFFHDTNVRPVYFRKDGSIGLTYKHEYRGVMRAIESYIGAKFDEKKDFSRQAGPWKIDHYHLCNGLTILSRNNP